MDFNHRWIIAMFVNEQNVTRALYDVVAEVDDEIARVGLYNTAFNIVQRDSGLSRKLLESQRLFLPCLLTPLHYGKKVHAGYVVY
jgi:hypothetical protein